MNVILADFASSTSWVQIMFFDGQWSVHDLVLIICHWIHHFVEIEVAYKENDCIYRIR